MSRIVIELALCCLAVALVSCTGPCPEETECYGHGDWDPTTQTCKCYSDNYNVHWESRYGAYTGTCCTSIKCSNANSTCVHGICGVDGKTCERCQTGWNGTDCDNAISCFNWLPCKHGKCVKSRFKCECEPGWVGDLCDRSLCDSSITCVYGSCPDDPKTCKCSSDFIGPKCDRLYCADGWECLNGGYCVDVHHCVCPQYYTGEHCETISGCSVPCEHGRCATSPGHCDCEHNWKGTNCSTYIGICNNCSSVGGSCSEGPDTCECKPGYTGPQCAVKKCDGCANGACQISNGLKHCVCDKGWTNTAAVPGFDQHYGPCTTVTYCITPCMNKGTCPTNPYRCVCKSPYVGAECDTIRCPKCCPPETCDCSNPAAVRCRTEDRWHHNCCLVKSCFRGDTLVHTARGLIPIQDIKEGDEVVTRHEGDDSSVTYLRKVDGVFTKTVSPKDLVVLRSHGEDIWTTYNHPFFEQGGKQWIAAEDISTKHVLHALHGKTIKLKQTVRASHLASNGGHVRVYDLLVHEYDRYAVGRDGFLVSSCNVSNVLLTRDKQVWGKSAHPMFAVANTRNEGNTKAVESGASVDGSPRVGLSSGLVAGIVVGAFVVLAVIAVSVCRLSSKRRLYRNIDDSYVTGETPVPS